MRPSARAPDQLRAVTLTRGFTKHAEGSVLVAFGDTRVLCTASVEARTPGFLRGTGQGWVTAEYGMLPRATNTRTDREASRGKQGGRTLEIQRLIGRSLRACVDRDALGERTITLDCDVLQADGGTRTAAITGAYVALVDAVRWLQVAVGHPVEECGGPVQGQGPRDRPRGDQPLVARGPGGPGQRVPAGRGRRRVVRSFLGREQGTLGHWPGVFCWTGSGRDVCARAKSADVMQASCSRAVVRRRSPWSIWIRPIP